MRNRFLRTRLGTVLVLGMSALAVLIWGRLKLVTGVPRSAYAVPKLTPIELIPRPRVEPARRQAVEPARRHAVEAPAAATPHPIGD
ncbi:MAG: hypothetical protein ACKVW3_13665 [Phycisphaerales bacterium]